MSAQRGVGQSAASAVELQKCRKLLLSCMTQKNGPSASCDVLLIEKTVGPKATSFYGESKMTAHPQIRAPRGNTLTARGWIQEAAKRMLMNNLDPEVAEKPEQLIVYGGRGKAARNWECYHTIIETLDRLENDQTLLVQSGKASGGVEHSSGLRREF